MDVFHQQIRIHGERPRHVNHIRTQMQRSDTVDRRSRRRVESAAGNSQKGIVREVQFATVVDCVDVAYIVD